MSIPHELIAAIIDELHLDRASLKACSLAAIAFCSPSQRYLFSSMWLHRENWQFYTAGQQALHRGTATPSGTMRRVSALLTDSPHLASYVRDLTIDLPDSADEDIPLERVLKAVTNVERFVISGLNARWDELSLPLTSTILDVLARPALERLHLLNMRNVPAPVIFRALSSMRVLSIHNTSFDEDDSEEESPEITRNPTPLPLEHLMLSTGLTYTYALILAPHAPKLTNVKQLFLRVDMNARSLAERLLSAIAGTLEHLEVDCGELSTPIYLPHLPHLRSLTLRIFRGLSRRLPDGLAGTLAAFPHTSLTLLFAIQNRLVEGKWLDEGPLLGLDDWEADAIHCQLLFLAPKNTRSSMHDATFDAFCAAMRDGLPGYPLEFSRADEEQSYVVKLPW
ncbi:hypothetical protein C8R44DRAFT_974178 [Mycena epipterygia]|nr:hypothetical protein C8R44DRAFT_974178 [Mycena epipterygia]